MTVISKAARKAQTMRHGNTIFKFGASFDIKSVKGGSSEAGFGPLPSSGWRSSRLAMTSLRLLPSLGIAEVKQTQEERRRAIKMSQDRVMDQSIVPTLQTTAKF
jgi:hypothetical protein